LVISPSASPQPLVLDQVAQHPGRALLGVGEGQEQGRSFAAQVFSVTQTLLGYSLLAYLLEHDEQSQTIGHLFRQLEEETGKLTFLDRLWQ